MTKSNIYTLLCALCALFVISCSQQEDDYVYISGIPMLGTELLIVADINPDSVETLYSEIIKIDSAMKAEMSIFDPNSRVSRINRGETDSLSIDMIYNITMADSISRLSSGLYDITVMPLVEAWGFARKQALKSPNIDSLLEFVGYEKISIKDGRLIKEDPRIKLDFNSIAKGYTVDKLAQRVAELGAQNYLVDIGGEINCQGVNSRGKGWTVGVESPIDGNMTDGEYLEKAITLPPTSPLRAIATSGNYRRFYLTDDGEKVSHTIDPATGHSKISKLLSATVFASNCALADSYATMFMAAGSQLAEELAMSIEGIEVYFIFSDGESGEYREFLTPGMAQMVK